MLLIVSVTDDWMVLDVESVVVNRLIVRGVLEFEHAAVGGMCCHLPVCFSVLS